MSEFGQEFTSAFADMQRVLGDDVTYYSIETGLTTTIQAIFNEFVGAVDDLARSIITVSEAQVPNPRREDKLTINGVEWTVIDIRSDEAGTHELRCDRSMTDV